VQVVVVNLLREGCRSGRTGVEVKSNESEGATALLAVDVDKLALPKAHVVISRRRSIEARCGTAESLG